MLSYSEFNTLVQEEVNKVTKTMGDSICPIVISTIDRERPTLLGLFSYKVKQENFSYKVVDINLEGSSITLYSDSLYNYYKSSKMPDTRVATAVIKQTIFHEVGHFMQFNNKPEWCINELNKDCFGFKKSFGSVDQMEVDADEYALQFASNEIEEIVFHRMLYITKQEFDKANSCVAKLIKTISKDIIVKNKALIGLVAGTALIGGIVIKSILSSRR